MGVFEERCFGCICDRCGEHYEASITGFSIFCNEEQLREGLDEDGWHEIDGKWYCPDCHHMDDESEEYVPNAHLSEEANVLERIKSVVRSKFSTEFDDQSCFLSDLHFNDMDCIDFENALEEEFGITLPYYCDFSDGGEFYSVSKVAEYIESLLAEKNK